MGVVNYLQDCSTFQSEDIGLGVEYLEEKKRAWLLSSWRIVIDRYPVLGERIKIRTWATSSKGIYGYRDFVIMDQDGNYLVRAESIWFFCDTEKMVPVRVMPEDVAAYGNEEALDLGKAPRKILIPEEYEEGIPVTIATHHLDTNHHVNNAQYVDIARELVPSGTEIGEIRAEYRKAAVLGDEIVVKRAREGMSHLVSLCNANGDVFANVELKRGRSCKSIRLREDERHDGNRKNSETESDQREGLRNLSL